MTETREYMLRVRITQEERQMLEALAKAMGLTASDIARLGIRQQHEARFGAQPTKGKRRLIKK